MDESHRRAKTCVGAQFLGNQGWENAIFWDDSWNHLPKLGEDPRWKTITGRGREEGRVKVCHYQEDPALDDQRRWLNQEGMDGLTFEEDLHSFQADLQDIFIHVQAGPDILRWGYNKKGSFSIKDAYDILSRNREVVDGIWKKIWETNPWLKIAILCWIIVRCRILTRENIRRRGIYGPSQCVLCLNSEKSMSHLLEIFPYTDSIWDIGASIF